MIGLLRLMMYKNSTVVQLTQKNGIVSMKGRIQRPWCYWQGPIPITHLILGRKPWLLGSLGPQHGWGKLRFHKFWEVFFWKVLSESRSKGRYKKHPTVSNSKFTWKALMMLHWSTLIASKTGVVVLKSANTALAEPHPVELSLKILRCLLFCCSALPDWRPRSLRPRWVSQWEEPEISSKSKEILYQLEIVA